MHLVFEIVTSYWCACILVTLEHINYRNYCLRPQCFERCSWPAIRNIFPEICNVYLYVLHLSHFASIQNGSSCKGRSRIYHMTFSPQIDFCCFRSATHIALRRLISPLHGFINLEDYNIIFAVLLLIFMFKISKFYWCSNIGHTVKIIHRSDTANAEVALKCRLFYYAYKNTFCGMRYLYHCHTLCWLRSTVTTQ